MFLESFGNVSILLAICTLMSMIMVATASKRNQFACMMATFAIGMAFLLSVVILIGGAK